MSIVGVPIARFILGAKHPRMMKAWMMTEASTLYLYLPALFFSHADLKAKAVIAEAIGEEDAA